MVDNYKDAKATKIEIRLEPQGADKQRLIFSGDGKEADAGEVLDIGESTKRLGDPLRDETQIGGYGMGMKNALMHLAADALIICRKQRDSGPIWSVAMLSSTMHIREGLDRMCTPRMEISDHTELPSSDAKWILQYGPFSTAQSLGCECKKLEKLGMRIIVYNLHKEKRLRALNGDILYDNQASLKRSLHECYLSLQMELLLQGEPVQMRVWEHVLFRPMRHFISKETFSGGDKQICVVIGFDLDRQAKGKEFQNQMGNYMRYYLRGRRLRDSKVTTDLGLNEKSSKFNSGLTVLVLDRQGAVLEANVTKEGIKENDEYNLIKTDVKSLVE